MPSEFLITPGIRIELTTPRVQALITPGPACEASLTSAQSPDPLKTHGVVFQKRLALRQSQGYVDEDAAVLAVFDTGLLACAPGQSEPRAADLLRFDCFPRLIDHGHVAYFDCAALPFTALRDATPGVYPIVDNLSHLHAMFDAGARIVQLRMKSDQGLTVDIDRCIGQAVAQATHYPRTQLFINDYWQAALHHGAEGLHLGQEDLLTADLRQLQQAGIRLGVSSHAFWEVARAGTLKPSYIACGPVFPTRAKAMPWIAQGLGNLRYWAQLLPFPVVGIGGINALNLPAIAQTGCASASVIQAIVASPDLGQAYQHLQSIWLAEARSARSPQSAITPIPEIALAQPTLQRPAMPMATT